MTATTVHAFHDGRLFGIFDNWYYAFQAADTVSPHTWRDELYLFGPENAWGHRWYRASGRSVPEADVPKELRLLVIVLGIN